MTFEPICIFANFQGLFSYQAQKQPLVSNAASCALGSDLPFATIAHKNGVEA
jgi:hypothetical protein